jgi:hypothetical protein
MNCERCQGSREVRVYAATIGWTTLPCPDCNGCGKAHCCDGLREQPANDDHPSEGYDVSGCPDNERP